MNTYTVELISKLSDLDIKFEGIKAANSGDAKELALSYMANSKCWLVTNYFRTDI